MTSPSNPKTLGFYGKRGHASGIGEFNKISFLVRQILNVANIATMVKVVACTNDGDLSPVGYVDVLPLVNQLDGENKPVPHTTVYGLPYLRVQGGRNAVIIDPEPGDIGIAVFSDRDISAVKTAKAQANPGSFRRNDMSDGMYIGGVLNDVPTQYMMFSASGIKVLSPTKITLEAPLLEIIAPSGMTVDTPVAVYSGDVVASDVSLVEHLHGGVDRGSDVTDPPIPTP